MVQIYLLQEWNLLCMKKSEMIASKLKNRNGNRYSLKKKTVSHTNPGALDGKSGTIKIDVGDLTEIHSVDTRAMQCKAESGVTFSRLVRETLKYGLIPKCVSELKNITIGGAVSGFSVESMSFRYGGFHNSCKEYEIVTGTGEVLYCSREAEPDVFEMIHYSFKERSCVMQRCNG